ncbi:MAG: hypothetical protein ISS62_02860 [Desulfobacteraceae bacterium]|nr:hypothetical protein [Desulfobacteraceae bacterium]
MTTKHFVESKRIAYLFVGVVITAIVVGCASPGTTRQQEPAAHYKSSKSAKEVAACIADGWENLGLFGGHIPVHMRPTSKGYTLTVGDVRTQLLVDIIDVGECSETTYYKNFVVGEVSFDKSVKECQ